MAVLIGLAAGAAPLYGRWKDYQRQRWERAEKGRLLNSILNDAPAVGTVAFEEENAKALLLAKTRQSTTMARRSERKTWR